MLDTALFDHVRNICVRTIAIPLSGSLRRQKRVDGFDPTRGVGMIRPSNVVCVIPVVRLRRWPSELGTNENANPRQA